MAPRQLNKLLRVAGDLGLRDLLNESRAFRHHPSSMVRAASARAIGKLATLDSGLEDLQFLGEDTIEDVRKAADAALHDLRAPAIPVSETDQPESASLGGDARAALERLLEQLQSDGA